MARGVADGTLLALAPVNCTVSPVNVVSNSSGRPDHANVGLPVPVSLAKPTTTPPPGVLMSRVAVGVPEPTVSSNGVIEERSYTAHATIAPNDILPARVTTTLP